MPQTSVEMQQALQELPFTHTHLLNFLREQGVEVSKTTLDDLSYGRPVSDKKFQAFQKAFAETVPYINNVKNERNNAVGALRAHLGLPEDFADWDNLAANEKARELHKQNPSLTYDKMERLLTGKSVEWQTIQLVSNAIYDTKQAPDSAENNLASESISPHLRLRQGSVSK